MKIQLPLVFTFSILLASCTTISFTSSSTSTPAPYSDELFTEPLSSLVLTPSDFPSLDINYPQLIEPEVQDLTTEIQNCGKDCVKMVWKSKPIEGVGEQQVSITLIRMDTNLQVAEKTIISWNEFSQVKSGTGFTEGALVQSDLLPHNSKVGIRYKEPDVEVAFTGSRGPIYLMLVYYFQASGDLVLDFGTIQHLAILQIEKLQAAGYPE